jgi:UDP-N-acetyl-D-glucosamine dehydrogenase
LADKVNSGMPRFVVARAMESLNEHGKTIRGARVHILGVTYKRNTRDSRESPAIEIIKLLSSLGAVVIYSDPYVPSLRVEGKKLDAIAPDRIALASCDLAVIITDHASFDYREIVRNAPLVFDTRNATEGIVAENVVRL